ncbi:hypothetical protein LIER_07116 [Lithospermum erythrorhizon]|uniref:Uncharacterized protein n=1 Tax=Lithospermum erythrorhizon TaxID=34254 RepID=A0AAV3P8F1_LITER
MPGGRGEEAPEGTVGRGGKLQAFIRVLDFVKKYMEKYPDLRSDYKEFQEGYGPSWFEGLTLDASSNDDAKDETPSPREAALQD